MDGMPLPQLIRSTPALASFNSLSVACRHAARRSTSPLTLAAAACVALAGPALVALAAAAAAAFVALAGRTLVTLAAAALVALATAAACVVLAGPALVAYVALTGRALSRSTPPPPLALCSRCLTRSANVSSLPGRMMPKKCKSSLGFI
nr:uncharacterized protein LOC4348395 [Oryza sativa Japonica Group]